MIRDFAFKRRPIVYSVPGTNFKKTERPYYRRRKLLRYIIGMMDAVNRPYGNLFFRLIHQHKIFKRFDKYDRF